MKNRLIKKALCVALASTMVFGEALPAMAAAAVQMYSPLRLRWRLLKKHP